MSDLSRIGNVGTIVAYPQGASSYGLVRDEYDNLRSVDAGELPANGRPGDDFAYRVEQFQHTSGPQTTLIRDEGRDAD